MHYTSLLYVLVIYLPSHKIHNLSNHHRLNEMFHRIFHPHRHNEMKQKLAINFIFDKPNKVKFIHKKNHKHNRFFTARMVLKSMRRFKSFRSRKPRREVRASHMRGVALYVQPKTSPDSYILHINLLIK